MSNRRRRPWSNAYRTEYLRSRVWFARRDKWFRDQDHRGIRLTCAACGRAAAPRELELHHADYRGVIRTSAGWVSREKDADLIPLHPLCHELVHRLIERDRVLARHRHRPDASRIAIARLHGKLAPREAPV